MTNYSSWVEKYRPSSLADFVFQDEETRIAIEGIVKEQKMEHLLFSGPPGTGKTSCAFMLVGLLGIDPLDFLVINASKENSVDVVREKISNFSGVAPFGSPFRVILLEEGDHITAAGQGAMRRLFEDTPTVRFILTCNKPQKIIPPMHSRFQHLVFKSLPLEGIVEKVVAVLEAEKVEWDLESVQQLIEFTRSDLRKLLNTAQLYSKSGKLRLPSSLLKTDVSGDILTLVEDRQYKAAGLSALQTMDPLDIEDMFPLVFQSILDDTKLKPDVKETMILTLAEYLHRHGSIADPAINFYACCIELQRAIK